MKAFGSSASSDRHYITHWKCQWYLPQVSCTACGEVQWDSFEWYPSLSPSKGTDISKLSNEVVVSVEEFDTLVSQLQGRARTDTRIQPAAGLGPVFAKMPKHKSDFFWCEGRPIIARRTLETLINERFEIATGPVFEVKTGGATEYLAWQVPVVALYSGRILKQLKLVRCVKCKGWKLENMRAQLSGVREYVASRVLEKWGLVRAEEGGETLATNSFIQFVERHNLTGIKFKEWGCFV